MKSSNLYVLHNREPSTVDPTPPGSVETFVVIPIRYSCLCSRLYVGSHTASRAAGSCEEVQLPKGSFMIHDGGVGFLCPALSSETLGILILLEFVA